MNISDPTTQPAAEGATATVAETNTATTATVDTATNATSTTTEKVEQVSSKKSKKKSKKKGGSSKAKSATANGPTTKAPAKKAKATVTTTAKTEKKTVQTQKPAPAKKWRKSSVAARRTAVQAKKSNAAMKGPKGVRVGVGRGGNQPKGEMSGRAKRRAIAQTIALRSPKGLISIEAFRAICQQKGVYNAANFTQDMKKDAKLFKPVLQKGELVGWTLTPAGKKSAVELAAKAK